MEHIGHRISTVNIVNYVPIIDLEKNSPIFPLSIILHFSSFYRISYGFVTN